MTEQKTRRGPARAALARNPAARLPEGDVEKERAVGLSRKKGELMRM